MNRPIALAGSALFLVIAPGFLALWVPWRISGWLFGPPFLGMVLLRYIGAALAALGAIGLVDSFLRFAVQGMGTPAPVAPPRRLVVSGLYRYVRNPMYVAVVSVILGQGLLFGNLALLEYGACTWLIAHLFVLLYEEPTLRRIFGSEYEIYYREVPRWIPRLTAWAN